jgi:hypothetical protein
MPGIELRLMRTLCLAGTSFLIVWKFHVIVNPFSQFASAEWKTQK